MILLYSSAPTIHHSQKLACSSFLIFSSLICFAAGRLLALILAFILIVWFLIIWFIVCFKRGRQKGLARP